MSRANRALAVEYWAEYINRLLLQVGKVSINDIRRQLNEEVEKLENKPPKIDPYARHRSTLNLERTDTLKHWVRTIRRLMTSDGLGVDVTYDSVTNEIRVHLIEDNMEENKNDTAKIEQEKDPSKRIVNALYALEAAVNWNVSVLPKDQLAVMNQVKDAVRTGLNARPALKAFVDLMENEARQVTWRVLGHRANALLREAKAAIDEADPLGDPIYGLKRLISPWWNRLEAVAASLGALPKDDPLEVIEREVKRLKELQANWTRGPGYRRMLGALKDLVDIVRRGRVIDEGGIYRWTEVLEKELAAAMLEAGAVIGLAEEADFHDHKKHESVPGVEGKPVDAEFPEVAPAPPPSWWVIEMLGPAYITVSYVNRFQWTEQIEQAVQFTNEADANHVREALAILEPDLFPVRLLRPATTAEYFWSAPGVASKKIEVKLKYGINEI